MADIIAIARGRGRDSESECTRLASREGEVRINTWRTFVTVTMQKDGSAVINIERTVAAGGCPALLTEITVNSELSESPILSCDGLLREQVIAGLNRQGQPARSRTLASDLAEDR